MNNNRNHNKNFSSQMKQNLSINYSNERITYTNNNINKNSINTSQNTYINKNNYKDNNNNSVINTNKINHTSVNSPSRAQISTIQIKIKNCKDNTHKVYLRTGGNHNTNNISIKIPHITTVNSKENKYYNYSTHKTTDNNNNTNTAISTNLLKINNNSSFNYSSKNNKNKKKKNQTNNNSTCKTISHKQSYNNLINDNNISNINNKTDFNGNKNNDKKVILKNEINLSSNKSTHNHFQINNNTTTNVANHKKTPKIIDIKKCIKINNNKNNNNNNKDKKYNLVNNKRGKSVTNKTKGSNLINNRPNLKISNPNNNDYKNERGKKIIKNNTVFNTNSITHNSNYIDYTDIIDDRKKIKRNYSNSTNNKIIKSISNSRTKSLSKSKNGKIKNKINISEINELIEDIKKIKKNKIIHTSNITANPSNKNSFNQSKNTMTKKIKTLTVSVTNSNNNSTLKNNNNNTVTNNNSIILFESETKERKKSLINQGKYYIKECERLSKYIKEYYLLNDNYPKSQVSFYKYGRLIGKGAFGKVNLGLHILTGRIVAIKSFNLKKLKSERAKAKIYHEINLIKNLRHSSVVKILDTFETNDYILIVMENISGGDLLSFVKKRTKLNEKICKFIFKQLLQALKFIHSKNIIHRDIKLDNVLIDLNNNIKLCDFGVGKMIHEGEILTDQCGTPAYIAPEILENKGYEGPPVDVWSSGVVLYAMLCGTVPFKSNNLNDLQNMIMAGNFKEVPELSKESNDLLHKLLQINPKKRITIDEALNHQWFNSNTNNVGENDNIFEENKLSLFTKAEMVLLSKNFVDYRNCAKEEMIENFTLKNLDTKNISENKNNLTKSFIFAPFNSSYVKEELKITHLEDNISIENNIILFDEKINILNRQYELNNNGEIDHGILINRSNMSSRSNNINAKKDNEQKSNNLKENKIEAQPAQNTEEEKTKKILSCSNSKKSININKEKELNVPNRNKGNNMNSMLTYSSTAILDENILKYMENFGYKKEYIQKCITNNEVNYCTATYYLLSNSSEIVT
jgi:serine/threonine protein kinase